MEAWENHVKQMIRTRLWTLATERSDDLRAILAGGAPIPMYEVVIQYFRSHAADWDWFFQHKELLVEKHGAYLNTDHYELVDRIFLWYAKIRKRKVQKKSVLDEVIKRIDKQIYDDV